LSTKEAKSNHIVVDGNYSDALKQLIDVIYLILENHILKPL